MTIDRWIVENAKSAPDKIAIEYKGKALTYKDFAANIADTAADLRARGIGHGDRVAWYGMNEPQVFVLLFACARLGAMFVPLNWRLADDEIDHVWASAEPAAIFADEAFAEKAARLRPFAPAGRDDAAQVNDPLLIVYTSGSTGVPKGVLLSQDAVAANAEMSVNAHGMVPDDTVLSVLPLFHVGGLNIMPTPAFSIGATVILHQSFDPVEMVKALQEVQTAVMVPTVLAAVLATPEWEQADLSSLRCLSIGATDVPVEMIAKVHARGIPMFQIYGLTETTPIAIHQTHWDCIDTIGSIGKSGTCDVRLVQPDGTDAPTDAPGEIWVRGRNILLGYWRNPEATEKAVENGWFKTGDVASRDAEGNFYFQDRMKHIIISGGENIYPAEIERILRVHPAVREVAVVGVPDEKWGETPTAVIVANYDETPEVVLGSLDGALARYKHPHHVVFVDTLPRNALGKVITEAIRGLAIDAVAESANNGDAITEPG